MKQFFKLYNIFTSNIIIFRLIYTYRFALLLKVLINIVIVIIVYEIIIFRVIIILMDFIA